MFNIPETKSVNTSTELALIDAPIGTEIWVIDDEQNWKAVPRPITGAIAGPSASVRMWWAPADAADGKFGPFASIAEFRAATPPSTWTEVTIEGVGSGLYKHDAGANMVDDSMYVIRPTSIAATANGAFFLRQSIAPSLPRYVSGRDAASVLARLKSTAPKALFTIGDSRTQNLPDYAGVKWTNVPLGGRTTDWGGASTAAAIWTTSIEAKTAGSVATNSGMNVPYPTIGFGCAQSIFIATTAQTQTSFNSNSGAITVMFRAKSPLIVNAMDGVPFNLCVPVYACTAGVAGDRITIHSWPGAGSPWTQSAKFTTLSTENKLIRKHLVHPANVAIGTQIYAQYAFDGAANTVGECVIASKPWWELTAPYGATIHDFAITSTYIEDWLSETSYRTQGQYPYDTWTNEARVRCEDREPWALIDLGTNWLSPVDGVAPTSLRFEGMLMRLIERVRSAVRSPNMPIILRTAYPKETNDATVARQVAARSIAETVPHLALVDTYAAAYDGGGYPVAVANSWQTDTLHRNDAGRLAFEEMFNAIVGGGIWSYSSTLG